MADAGTPGAPEPTAAQRALNAATRIYFDCVDTGLIRPPDDHAQRARQMNDAIRTWTKIIEVANG